MAEQFAPPDLSQFPPDLQSQIRTQIAGLPTPTPSAPALPTQQSPALPAPAPPPPVQTTLGGAQLPAGMFAEVDPSGNTTGRVGGKGTIAGPNALGGPLNPFTGPQTSTQQQRGPAFPNGLNQQNFLQSVQGFPPTAEGFRSWWAQNQAELQAQGYSFIDHPRDPALILPDGTHIDAIQGAGAPGSAWQWLVKDLSGGGTGPNLGTGGQAASSVQTPLLNQLIQQQLSGQTQQQQQQDDFRNQIREQLMQQLLGAQQIPNINDPILAAQQQAFERAQQRAFERFQHQNAEQFSTRGLLDSGARNVATEGFLQQQGEAGAANAAGLVANDLMRRRSELMQLMNLAVGIQDADLTRELQQQLVLVDAELQRELGLAGLNLQELLGMGQLDLGFSGLAENASQFDALLRSGILGGLPGGG